MLALEKERWVPKSSADWRRDVDQLSVALHGRSICLLTGAGCSTESGIPDYRGEETARRARNPIQFKQFVSNEAGRRRYWARAMIGWPQFRLAAPSGAHLAARRLEEASRLSGTITQNVDRLHTRAGSRSVVELHGALEDVVCLRCGALEHRDELQARLAAANPGFLQQAFDLAPDGDADINEASILDFNVQDCRVCGGVLKPRVVFFGEGVPRRTVEAAWQIFDAADVLLVVGSSLAVFSGYRFVRRALKENKPVHLINLGTSRADPDASSRVAAPAGPALSRLADALR